MRLTSGRIAKTVPALSVELSLAKVRFPKAVATEPVYLSGHGGTTKHIDPSSDSAGMTAPHEHDLVDWLPGF